jgi:SAM-dependent methyltransferase
MSPRSSRPAPQDCQATIRAAVLDEQTFLRLTLSGQAGRGPPRWTKVSVRPVLIRRRRQWQFSYFDRNRNVVSNFTRSQLAGPLDEVLAMPFAHVEVQTTDGDLHIRRTRKGKVLMTRGRASREHRPSLAHDRPKDYLLPPAQHATLLAALGIADRRGQVRPTAQAKFAQVNEFLRVIDQTVAARAAAGRATFLLDCGCGSAHLTFAAYHFLRDVRGLDVRVAGVDVKAELIRKCEALRDGLGWTGLEFSAGAIRGYQPPGPVDAVLSLHACDTATDEAIARGVDWGARVILAAPCCQHELHDQLEAEAFRPLLRHGILRERLADLLTDTFRALALRIMGYRTAVVEFISPEHTAKNLLIRGEAGLKRGDAALVRQYLALRDFWRVTPTIERLLGDPFARLLGQ